MCLSGCGEHPFPQHLRPLSTPCAGLSTRQAVLPAALCPGGIWAGAGGARGQGCCTWGGNRCPSRCIQPQAPAFIIGDGGACCASAGICLCLGFAFASRAVLAGAGPGGRAVGSCLGFGATPAVTGWLTKRNTCGMLRPPRKGFVPLTTPLRSVPVEPRSPFISACATIKRHKKWGGWAVSGVNQSRAGGGGSLRCPPRARGLGPRVSGHQQAAAGRHYPENVTGMPARRSAPGRGGRR